MFKKSISIFLISIIVFPLFSMTALAFTFADVTDVDIGYLYPRSIWSDGSYIYVGTTSFSGQRELFAYSFNGSSYNLEGQITTAFQDSVDLHGDNNYIYMAEGGNGIKAFSFDGSNFTLLDTRDDLTSVAHGVWADDNYVYLAGSADGLYVYTFDGNNFSAPIDSIATTPNAQAYDVWGDGNNIFVANGNYGIAAYSFNGSSFTELDTLDTANLTTANDIWGDGTYIYVADSTNGVCAYTFIGNNFSEISCSGGGTANSVIGGNDLIYAARITYGLYAYSFDGASFSLESSINESSGAAYDVWFDGVKYFHLANYGDTKVYAYEDIDYISVPEFDKYIYIAAIVLIMGFMIKVIPRTKAKA